MSGCTSPWWPGLTCDHLYADCPSRRRGEAELRRVGWWFAGKRPVDPHGTDICGLCLHRHNRTAHKEPA